VTYEFYVSAFFRYPRDLLHVRNEINFERPGQHTRIQLRKKSTTISNPEFIVVRRFFFFFEQEKGPKTLDAASITEAESTICRKPLQNRGFLGEDRNFTERILERL
jgi:hypothetical protein